MLWKHATPRMNDEDLNDPIDINYQRQSEKTRVDCDFDKSKVCSLVRDLKGEIISFHHGWQLDSDLCSIRRILDRFDIEQRNRAFLFTFETLKVNEKLKEYH